MWVLIITDSTLSTPESIIDMSHKTTAILDCLAGSGKVMSRAEIKDQTGISTATLSRVLRNLLRTEYIEKIERGRYRAGRKLRRFASRTVFRPGENVNRDIFFVSQSMTFAEKAYHGAREILYRNGLRCIAFPTAKPLRDLDDDDMVQFENAAGIMVFTLLPMSEKLKVFAKERNIPIVKVGMPEHSNSCDSVSWDQVHGYCEMTSRLIDMGFKTIIFYSRRGVLDAVPFIAIRIEGYDKAMRAAGLEPVHFIIGDDGVGPGNFQEHFKMLVEDSEAPIAVLFDNFKGRYSELIEKISPLGLEPGPDLRFCGLSNPSGGGEEDYSDSRLLLYIDEPWIKVGMVGGEKMIQRLKGDNSDHTLIYVRPEIIRGGREHRRDSGARVNFRESAVCL